jgi:uncharacterized protein DUF4382
MSSHRWSSRLALLFLALLPGCSDRPAQPVGTVQIRLTDAPAALGQTDQPLPIDAIKVVVTEVSIQRAPRGLGEGAHESRSILGPDRSTTVWERVKARPTTYDLLALRGGASATLATAIVPSGSYTEIRLAVGADSRVVVDGATYPLAVPGDLRLDHVFSVSPGGRVDLTIDVDAETSVHQADDGTWRLEPAMTVTSGGGRGLGGGP